MHNGSFPPPDPEAIARDRVSWRPLSREEAVRACASRKVAVVYRIQGLPAAAWLSPASRFYGTDQPLLYEQFRYYASNGNGKAHLGELKALRVNRPVGEAELLQALDEAGDVLNLGSPVPGAANKPKKKLPIEFQLTDAQGNPMPGVAYEAVLPDGKGFSGKSDSEGFIKFPDNVYPGEAKLKLVPDPAHTPADASRGSGSPDLAADASEAESLGDIPGLPSIPRPTEILLVDESGAPLGNRAFTARFPDGRVETGRSSRSGLIQFPDNVQSGDLVLTLTDPDAVAAA